MSLLACERKFTIVTLVDALYAVLARACNMITLFLYQEAVAIRHKIFSCCVKIAIS